MLVNSPATQHTPRSPLPGRILRNDRLTPADYPEDIRHIIIDLQGVPLAFVEGQSIGVIPPGTEKNGRPHRPRLFTIASPIEGEPGLPGSLSICVKRTVFEDENHTTQRGICSNYLCDLKEGSPVQLTGPNGKNFALPIDKNVDLLCFATGTGIAPYRGFLFRRFQNRGDSTGDIHLFYGSRTRQDHVYANDLNTDLLHWRKEPNFFLHSALSREDPDQRIHIGDLLTHRTDEIEAVLDRQNYIVYICGLRGMEKDIEGFFRMYLGKKTGNRPDDGQWAEMKEQLKHAGRWAQEVY